MTPAQMQSPFFTNLAIRWISWLFDFKLLGIDRERGYLAFTCKHLQSNGKCGNYFWRPNICRNYPLTDYFEKPVFLPGCGFYAKPR
jgi:Fe-S-cluster containining protein